MLEAGTLWSIKILPGLARNATSSLARLMWTETGQSETVMFPTKDDLGRPVYDPNELLELEHKTRESVARGFKEEKPRKHTTQERKDLGKIFLDIKASKDYKRENNHSRYWLGVN